MNATVLAALIILITLVVAFMIIGIKFRKMTLSSADYLMAGRSLPFWLLAGSFAGGSLGGATVSGFTGYGYAAGWSSAWCGAFTLGAAALFTVLYSKRINYFGRTAGAFTIIDFICARYDERLRVPAGVIAFFRPAAQCGIQFLSIAVVLKVAFNIPINLGTIIAACIIFLYCFTAGQYSAIIIQWMQSIIQTMAMLIATFAAFRLIGDPGRAVDAFYSVLPEQMVSATGIAPVTFWTWLFTLGLYYFACPSMFMWAYMGKDPRTTVNAQILVNGIGFLPVLPYFCGMGVAAAAAVGAVTVPEMGSDLIYSWLAINKAPVIMGTVMIVGLMTSTLSAGSSLVMNGAALLARDIGFKGKDTVGKEDDARLLKYSRAAVALTLVIGVAVANGVPQLITLWVLIQAIVMSGIWCPVMFAWHWKRATSAGALASCLGGAAAALVWAVTAWVKYGAPGSIVMNLHCVHAGMIVSCVLMIIVSLATKHSPDEDIDATYYKSLGGRMHAADPEYAPGLWGYFGAKTAAKKFLWSVCIALLLLHIAIMPVFRFRPVGTAFVWGCVAISFAAMFLFLILGGRDIRAMIRGMKEAAAGRSGEAK